MDAKELTTKYHEHENQLAELRGRVHKLETENAQLIMKVKDLSYLEGYVNQINERLKDIERKMNNAEYLRTQK